MTATEKEAVKYYTKTHEWVQVAGNEATVGVTDYAQDELGEIVYVELPEVGSAVTSGDDIAVLESTKAAADVYTPLSGSVLAVNEALEASPDLVNKEPVEGGWLFKLELSSVDELSSLLSEDEYNKMTQ